MSKNKDGTKTNGNAIGSAERQRQALELRKAGCTLAVIADRLGYAGPQGAHEAIRKGIAAIPREAAEDVRAMELERLDRMMLGLYDKAIKGHEGAVDRVLRIMDRRARYLGLDTADTNPPPGDLSITIYDGTTTAPPGPPAPPRHAGRGDEAGAGDQGAGDPV